MLAFFKSVFVLGVLALLGTAGYAAWYVATPLEIAKLPVEFEIPQGARLRTAIQRIEASGIASGRIQFELLARALGTAQDIKAGSYEITQAVTPIALLEKLTRGDVTQADISFIEGWTFLQLRAALDANAFLRHQTKGLDDARILARLGAAESRPEGLFFPDTYLFAKGASDISVLRRAYRAMQRNLASEWSQRDPSAPYQTPYEALIMASIVEKETGRAQERDLIGGVMVNRLRKGMLLQADPTVIYGIGPAFDGNLRKIDLSTDGPYNTYTRAGLPPTPIAMPGLASLRAALRPARTDALYYVARGDGTSEFSRTLEQHNRAVSKYQLQPRRK